MRLGLGEITYKQTNRRSINPPLSAMSGRTRLKHSHRSSTTDHHWLIWASLLTVVSILAGIACGPKGNIEAPATPVPTPPSLPSTAPVLRTPSQVATFSPSPSPPAPSASTGPAVHGEGKPGQTLAPTATLVPTGVPTLEPNLDPAPEAKPPPFKPMGDGTSEGPTMSLGLVFACALESDGKTLCWNFTKELEADFPAYEGPLSPPPEGEIFVSITSSSFHSCGLREDGSPVCWPAIDDPELSSLNPPPQGVRFSSINSRRCYTCGLRADGTPLCWAQIIGATPCQDYELVEPPDGEKFADLTGGEGFSCGLRHDGTFLCYPDVQGASISDMEALPKIPEGERFSAISMGSWSFCALREDGTPTCWYWNVMADSWGRNQMDPDVGKLVSISTGAFHSCGLRETGQVVCWWSAHPEEPGPWPSEDARFVAIASKDFYSCGLAADGSRMCWYANPPN